MGKWILPSTGLVWLLGGYFLLIQQGMEEEPALVDAFFFALFFLGGFLLLDRVFRHYTPNRKNGFLLVLFPILLSGGLVWGHAQLLDWWFAEEPDYLEMLESSLLYRWVFLGVVIQLLALLAAVISKLEGLLLSDFLRGTLRSDGQSWISLADEIKYLEMYFDIERVRFGHRLVVGLEVEEGVESLKIPPLLVQPLVENAIKYGLYGTLGEVKISLRFQKEGNYLQVVVENPFDGQDSAPEGTGFGLSSLERRLFLIFGRTDLLEKSGAKGIFRVHLKI